MEHSYDYKRYAVLYVDDEEASLRTFTRAFEDQFRIVTATSAREGLELLERHKDEIGLLLTDQKMPGEKGVWLLERARQLEPRIVRILVTAYAEMDAAIAAVNTGAIYKYISKPWDPHQLGNTLQRGLEFFLVQKERDQLLEEKMSVLHNMMIADRIVSLGLLATGLSHHIRNALQAVRTFVDLAPVKMEEEKMDLQGLRNPDFWKEYYQNVQSQITKINVLLSDLCVASQSPDFQFPDVVQLGAVLSDVVGQLQSVLSPKRIRVEIRLPDDLPSLRVDRRKFYRLFELLLRDESVSLPEGSTVRISAKPFDATSSGRGEVEIEVQDDGPGLPQEALRLVFDPFVVRSDTPLEYGIHLMGCFFIVHHHGGRIDASTNGSGTKFTIRLPVNPESVPTVQNEHDFVQRVLLNQRLWQRLITGD